MEDKAEEGSKKTIYCEYVYLGNTEGELGCTITNPKICSNLLCSKCDTKISLFKNQKWSDSCDYLFFRNNYGDQIKLSEVLFNKEILNRN
jgi:hypothetical protein